jgi:hypothetical protein
MYPEHRLCFYNASKKLIFEDQNGVIVSQIDNKEI